MTLNHRPVAGSHPHPKKKKKKDPSSDIKLIPSESTGTVTNVRQHLDIFQCEIVTFDCALVSFNVKDRATITV